MGYRSTKTYGHELGLSCCFRQWRADHSHCSLLHGYALAVRIEFAADELDHRNWVQDFGGLKEVKNYLQDTFDHKVVVAADDPEMFTFGRLQEMGLAEIRVMERVGCEAFAEAIFKTVESIIDSDRVSVASVEVKEHGANSAIYLGDK